MFESDDFDQVLSQFDISHHVAVDVNSDANEIIVNACQGISDTDSSKLTERYQNHSSTSKLKNVIHNTSLKAPTVQTKRKIINSYFDHQKKRKFPGPAGLLNGTIEDKCESSLCQVELLSQDIDFAENHINDEVFESPLWKRVLLDSQSWNLGRIDSIKTIKQQALAGNLQRRKAEIIIAFVEAVDRSASDPLVILKDNSGSIKCTLHRDAWSVFSAYIISDYCALALWKPTVLTTGSAFKRHYLNITLSNIVGIYSSAVLNDNESTSNIDGYCKTVTEEFTIIRKENLSTIDENNSSLPSRNEESHLDGFDNSIFLDDLFD